MLTSVLLMSLFLLLLTTFSWSKNFALKSGDLFFQPLDCSLCTMIEEEEETSFSHIGLAVKMVNGEVYVLEAYQEVRLIPLKEFLAKTEKKLPVIVGRFLDKEINQALFYQKVSSTLGSPYDHQFSWNNVDRGGAEFYYCSELVSKVLFPIIDVEIPLKPMHFFKNREKWVRYFHGQPPDGELGNSPADLYQHEDLKIIGFWLEGRWSSL